MLAVSLVDPAPPSFAHCWNPQTSLKLMIIGEGFNQETGHVNFRMVQQWNRCIGKQPQHRTNKLSFTYDQKSNPNTEARVKDCLGSKNAGFELIIRQ